MKFYESLIMLRNATTETQVDDLEKALTKLIETTGEGSLVKYDRWGKLKLAHPVEHKDYAYFVLARYKISKKSATVFPKELNHLLQVKLNATIIRFVTLVLEEDVFDAPYKRPEAFIPSNTIASPRGFGSDKHSFGNKKTSVNLDDEVLLKEIAEAEESVDVEADA
jgi:ribosomal protein S6